MNLNTSYPLSEETKLSTEHGYIQFAQVGRPHGLKGGFFLKTKDRRTNWDNYVFVLVETNNEFQSYKVLNTYISASALVIQLDGLSTREMVDPLYNKRIYVHRSEISCNEDEYLVKDLQDFSVYTKEHGLVGHILNVVSFGAQDNLEIQLLNSKQTIYYPFLDQFIQEIDEKNKKMVLSYVAEFFENL